MAPPASTLAARILDRRTDENVGLRFEDQSWTHAEVVRECLVRAQLLRELRPEGPFHVGILLENVPEFVFLLGGAALAGAVVAGINPTRRGKDLERDIRHTDCGILISDSEQSGILVGLDIGVAPERSFEIDSERWRERVENTKPTENPQVEIDGKGPYLLIFTSGTTGDPKASICSQGRLLESAGGLVSRRSVTADDVIYQTMPMFHSNAQNAWVASVLGGATLALRRKFSASGFLPDVRRFGATIFNYVGKPLNYILATPEQPDDAENRLRLAYGNEGTLHDVHRFAERFGCHVTDSYGSTEGGITIVRSPDTPSGALGIGQPGTTILDPETGHECPPARFDENGKLANTDEAVGEIANRETAGRFEGYWMNDEADSERVRNGIYWSGDLGYRDAEGFLYFAGRGYDWLRVDGENIAAAPIERILTRYPAIELASVYAVPDVHVGDAVMAAVAMTPGAAFDGSAFVSFLSEQADLGTKWAPRYVRVATSLPTTQTHKILKRVLRDEGWRCDDPVWVRDDRTYRRLEQADIVTIERAVSRQTASRGGSA